MFFLRFCTAIIGLIILAPFLAYSGTLDYPDVPTAMAADMLDSNKGVASPNPRFTDNSNGTVTDNVTGLIWLQNANVAGARNWADALTDSSNNNPALPSGYSNFFSNVQSDSYWSSDTLKGGIAYAWVVNMSDHGIMDTANKTETCYVWPVRGGK